MIVCHGRVERSHGRSTLGSPPPLSSTTASVTILERYLIRPHRWPSLRPPIARSTMIWTDPIIAIVSQSVAESIVRMSAQTPEARAALHPPPSGGDLCQVLVGIESNFNGIDRRPARHPPPHRLLLLPAVHAAAGRSAAGPLLEAGLSRGRGGSRLGPLCICWSALVEIQAGTKVVRGITADAATAGKLATELGPVGHKAQGAAAPRVV